MKDFDVKIQYFDIEQAIAAYNVLKVEVCANFTHVKKTYRKLAMTYHPDRNQDNKDPQNVETFTRISNAYAYLYNYQKELEQHKTRILEFAKNASMFQARQAPEYAYHAQQQARAYAYSKPQKRQAPEYAHPKPQKRPAPDAFYKQQQEKKEQEEKIKREQKAQAEKLKREQKEKAEKLKREQEALIKAKKEVESLRALFNVSAPNHLNVLQAQQYLIRECSTHLLNEAFEMKENVHNMLNHLNEIKQQINYELFILKNSASYIFYPDSEIVKKEKEQILKYYYQQIDSDIGALKILKTDFEFAFDKLKKDKSFSSITELNSLVDQLNTEIGNTQLRNYYSCDFKKQEGLLRLNVPRKLKLKNITRITEDFIRSNEKLSSHFTSLSQKALYKIDKNIASWKNIEKIKITNSPKVGFPDWLVKMQNLKEINLEANHITTLPENLGDLKQVETLNLNNNYLSSLPQCFTKLRNLDSLILSNNQFEHIPNEISTLTQLKKLNFSNSKGQNNINTIREIPEKLKELINLEELYLSGNRISYLPDAVIADWQKLAVLHIDDNVLTTLPKNIGDIASLKSINARNNHITFIPSSILKLRNKLRFFYLDQNLLHHQALAVAAIAHLMGADPNTLLSSQTLTESCPMELDNTFSIEDDEQLVNLSWEYANYLNAYKSQPTQGYQGYHSYQSCYPCYPFKSSFN